MERQFMKGCEAIAEAAIRAGCRFFSGYPITPQNEIPEYFSRRAPEIPGFVFRQGESEVASVNMVMGAAAGGARAMTSSSSPGVALKAEGLSYTAGSALPMVLVNVSRGGPGIGSIQPAQQDYWQATKALGSGGFRTLVFAPHTLQEAVDMMFSAFDYAERDNNPVVVLVDGCIGAMMEPVTLPDFVSDEQLAEIRKKRQNWTTTGFSRRDSGTMVEIGSGGGRINGGDPAFVEKAKEAGITWATGTEGNNKSMLDLQERWKVNDVAHEAYLLDDAEIVIASYGTAARVAKSAISVLRREGVKVGMLRPKLVNPFPTAAFAALDPAQVKHILDVEMSIPAQMVEDVEAAIRGTIPVSTCLRSGGTIISREEIVNAIKALL